jgi:hypothetical protein
MRDQEVLRANRELVAYFRGRRTEREARAALKIIKAFVRDRERRDAKSRSPLPGAAAARMPGNISSRKAVSQTVVRHRRKPRRKPREKPPNAVTALLEPQMDPEPSHSSESDTSTSE